MSACLIALLLAAPAQIALVHVNDTHSHLDAYGPKDANMDGTLGGLWKAASVIGQVRATQPNTLLVHAGDLFHGDLFFQSFVGVPELQLLDQLGGLDAFGLGNHEFEWGPDALYLALSTAFPNPADSPALSANLDFPAAPGVCAAHPASCALAGWVHPRSMKTVGGVKVGFFALTTPYDMIEQPAPIVVRTDLAATAIANAQALRADGAQVVVMISHLGLALSRQIVAAGADVDVVVNGHDHVALATPELAPRPGGGHALIVSAGEYYRYVGVLTLTVDGAAVSLASYALVPVDAAVPRLPQLAPAMQYLEAIMTLRYGDVFHTAIATAAAPFPNHPPARSPKRDTATGNLLTDVYRAYSGTDIAVEADGLQDGDLPAGPLSGEDLFRLMPYGYDAATGLGFHLVTFSLRGREIVKGLELGLAAPDVFLQVSGLRYEYDSCRPAGSRVLTSTIHVGGRKLDPGALYTVTANEFVVMALPALGIEIEGAPVVREVQYLVVRDAVAAAGTLYPEVQGRIRDVSWLGCRRRPPPLPVVRRRPAPAPVREDAPLSRAR